MIDFFNVRRASGKFLQQVSKSAKRAKRRTIGRSERLEHRELLTAVFAVTDTNQLLRFDTATPNLVTTIGTISGLQSGEQIQGIDFRPANGQLYALGVVDSTGTDTGRIYTIDIATGAATQVGSAEFSSSLIDSADWGIDFNPVPDRIRIVNDGEQNLRVNPDTAAVTTDSFLAYATGDANVGEDPALVGVAYTNNVAGATVTTLYGIDFNTVEAGQARIVRQGGVEGSPSPNLGQLSTVGSLGVTLATSDVGFDVDAHSGRAFASLNVGGTTSLYTVNLTTGAATPVNTIGNGTFVVRDISVVNVPAASTANVFAVNSSGQLVRFAANAPTVVTTIGTITGLQANEVIRGIDFRPRNGLLYALGVVNTDGTDAGRIYTINTSTAVATAVDSGAATFSTTLADAALYGFDFNPVPDRIRVVNSGEDNLRANPANGLLALADTPLAYDSTDANVGANPNIVGAAYTHSQSDPSSTTLYAIDGTLNRLVRQGSLDSSPTSPNAGLLFTIGSLGQTLSSSDVGFDIRPGTGVALAAFEVGGNTGLYTVNVTTGAATLVGLIGTGTTDITALAIDPEAHLEAFLADGGSSVTVSVSGGNLVVRDGSNTDLVSPTPVGDVNSLRIFGGTGADSITLDASLNGVFTGRLTILGNAGSDTVNGGSATFAVSVSGGSGDDTITTGSGADTISGGADNDLVQAGAGNDSVTGDAGNDILLGATGLDTISGGEGNDLLNGGAQNDRLDGGNGDDGLDGGTGSDELTGGAGANLLKSDIATDLVFASGTSIVVTSTSVTSSTTDVLRGTPTLVLTLTGTSGGSIDASAYSGATTQLGTIGNDSLTGGSGVDFIIAGSGNDLVDAGGGNDVVRGLAGNDTISGGAGIDQIDAGTGADSVSGGDGADTINGGDGNDTLLGDAGNDRLLGGIGSDVLRGGADNDVLLGEAGNDTLNGGAGDDSLDGGDGNDGLSGFTGNDTLIGGIGADTLIGGEGNDLMRGLAGNDILLGGAGNDTVSGDNNSDTVAGGDGEDVIVDAPAEINEAFVFTADWIDAV